MELMIVVVIVGILASVALPAYQQQVLKTKRSLGRAELLGVLARQEQFFVNNRGYATVLTDLGYPASPYYIDADGNDESLSASDSIYLIQLTSTAGEFDFLRAVPQLRQTRDTRCGYLQITSTGVKTAYGAGGVDECW